MLGEAISRCSHDGGGTTTRRRGRLNIYPLQIVGLNFNSADWEGLAMGEKARGVLGG